MGEYPVFNNFTELWNEAERRTHKTGDPLTDALTQCSYALRLSPFLVGQSPEVACERVVEKFATTKGMPKSTKVVFAVAQFCHQGHTRRFKETENSNIPNIPYLFHPVFAASFYGQCIALLDEKPEEEERIRITHGLLMHDVFEKNKDRSTIWKVISKELHRSLGADEAIMLFYGMLQAAQYDLYGEQQNFYSNPNGPDEMGCKLKAIDLLVNKMDFNIETRWKGRCKLPLELHRELNDLSSNAYMSDERKIHEIEKFFKRYWWPRRDRRRHENEMFKILAERSPKVKQLIEAGFEFVAQGYGFSYALNGHRPIVSSEAFSPSHATKRGDRLKKWCKF